MEKPKIRINNDTLDKLKTLKKKKFKNVCFCYRVPFRTRGKYI